MINYAIKKCANPKGIEGVDYYTPRVVKTSDYDMEELVGDINDATGMSDIDVHAVLYALGKQIRKGLLNGRTVVLEGVGRISVGMTAKCFPAEALTDKEFVPSQMIKEVHVNYRPDVGILRDLRIKRKLNRISSEAME